MNKNSKLLNKIWSISAAIIWGIVVLTGCSQPVVGPEPTPTPGPQNPGNENPENGGQTGNGGQTTDPNGSQTGNGGQQTQISNVVVFVNENGQVVENGQFVDVMATYGAIKNQVSQGKTEGTDYSVNYGSVTKFYVEMPENLMTDERFGDSASAEAFYRAGEDFYEGNGGNHDRDEYKTETSLIPGVKLVTNYAYRDQDFEGAVIQKALKFEGDGKDIVVKMPSGTYNLTCAYQGGIIKGDNNLTVENLNNTSISGTLYRKAHIKNFYDVFMKDKDASKLPNSLSLNLDYSHDPEYNDGINLAGSGIDKIIADWHNKKDSSDFELSARLRGYFNAKDLCSGDMYDAETGRFNDAYSIDINAAVVMSERLGGGGGVKNVLVNGNLKIDNGTVKGDNIRFAVDNLNGKNYKFKRYKVNTDNYGIVDFSNANVPNEVELGDALEQSKVIFKNLDRDVYFSRGAVWEFVLANPAEQKSHLKLKDEGRQVYVYGYTNVVGADIISQSSVTSGHSYSNWFHWKLGNDENINANDYKISHDGALISKVMSKESKKDLNPKQMNVLLGGKEYC